jgi:putative transposase
LTLEPFTLSSLSVEEHEVPTLYETIGQTLSDIQAATCPYRVPRRFVAYPAGWVLSGWRGRGRLELMPADLTHPARYAGYRFPTTVIHHALWLMIRFKFSLRTVQEILLERGIIVSHETLREWNLKFAHLISLEIKRRRSTPGKTWHLDEMHVVVRGTVMWLWRAVDEHGMVLDILLQEHRDTDAAKHFFEKLIKDHTFVPEKIVTDQLGSYEAAWKQMPAFKNVKHVFVKSEARLNNRIERDHEHVREKQRCSRG